MNARIQRYRQSMDGRAVVPWHAHRGGYAAIVLAGDYVEAGDGGRRLAGPGHVVIHAPFSGHVDRVGVRSVDIVNIPLSVPVALTLQSGTLADPEALLRDVAGDPASASAILAERTAPLATMRDLVDMLAADLDADGMVSIAEWADRYGVSPRTVTRQFTSLFEITPAHYRMRTRTLRAWREIVRGTIPLAFLAVDLGFADQAHMSRAVRALTGHPPSVWRRFANCLSD